MKKGKLNVEAMHIITDFATKQGVSMSKAIPTNCYSGNCDYCDSCDCDNTACDDCDSCDQN